MKKFFFLIIAAIFSVAAANAQLSKGNWMIGGSIDFSHKTQNNQSGTFTYNYKSTSLQASPGAGYFIIDKLAVGLRPGVTISNTTSTTNNSSPTSIGSPYLAYSATQKSTAYNIAPFVRYYFLPVKNKINLLADVSYTYTHMKASSQMFSSQLVNGEPVAYQSTASDSAPGNFISIFAGPSFFISQKVGLELLAGYTRGKYKNDVGPSNSLSLSAGLQVFLGK